MSVVLLGLWSQSPDGDFFDPEIPNGTRFEDLKVRSQSPDGDFFDPEVRPPSPPLPAVASHSPLTGIFLIRRTKETGMDSCFYSVTVP